LQGTIASSTRANRSPPAPIRLKPREQAIHSSTRIMSEMGFFNISNDVGDVKIY